MISKEEVDRNRIVDCVPFGPWASAAVYPQSGNRYTIYCYWCTRGLRVPAAAFRRITWDQLTKIYNGTNIELASAFHSMGIDVADAILLAIDYA